MRLLQKVSLPSSGKLCPLSREEGGGGPGPSAGHSLQRHVEEFESKVRFCGYDSKVVSANHESHSDTASV